MTASVEHIWTGGYSRVTALTIQGTVTPGSVTSTGIPVSNTEGNWLACIVSWRQDAGITGVLEYPTSVNVSDDAHNFWVPAASSTPDLGIVRTSIWVAPAARAAEWVYVSSTGYQQAFACMVLEITGAACPWYSFTAQTYGYTNQGTTASAAFTPPSGTYCIGVMSTDLDSLVIDVTAAGWTEVGSTGVGDGIPGDHFGDLEMAAYTAPGAGSSLSISATSTGGTADWAIVLLAVHGLDDVLPMPYTQPLPNWPVVITEMATGYVLNQNPSFSTGITPWTATNGTISASTSVTYQNSPFSALLTPAGGTTQAYISSNFSPVTPFQSYEGIAWVFSPGGYPDCQVNINWFTSGDAYISTTPGSPAAVPATGWSKLTLTATAPGTAAFGQLSVLEVSSPASTDLLYTGYGSIGVPGSYSATNLDELSWTDMSARNVTLEPMTFSRGIQYEQQSLEAGNCSFALDNYDGALNLGSITSPYYPQGGDTDIPVRVRAIWPQSVTPYYSLYYGYTDQLESKWSASWRSYVHVTASDVWSRLTAQLLTAATQEVFADNPWAYWQLGDAAGAATAANIANTPAGPLNVAASRAGATGITQTFGATTISLPGDPGPPGGTGWAVSGVTTGDQQKGYSLIYFPDDPASLPSLAAGVTVEFWAEFDAGTAGITWNSVIASAVGAKNPLWLIEIDEFSGGSPGQVKFIVYDKITGATTTTTVVSANLYGTGPWLFTVNFTQTAWSVVINGGSASTGGNASGSCNFSSVWNGFTFNGVCAPYGYLAGNCFNGEIYGIAVYSPQIPVYRSITHCLIPLFALPAGEECDVQRIGRVTGYGGFVPPLAMRGVDIINLPLASTTIDATEGSVDGVTVITDTSGQVTSFYMTNMATSTSAAMFVDGTGALVYRRREEWWDRQAGSWTMGEEAWVPLNENPVFSLSASPWVPVSNATLAWSMFPAFPLPFKAAAAWHGDGSTAAPGIQYGSSLYSSTYGAIYPGTLPISVVQGQSYTFVSSWYSAQGYTSSQGVSAVIQFTAANSDVLSTVTGTAFLPAGSPVYINITGKAPAGAAYANLFLQATGTPSSGITFCNGTALFYIAQGTVPYQYDYAPAEVPYMPDLSLSTDRALLYNSAYITQYGNQVEVTSLSGNSLNFQDSSGVIVQVQNPASILQRAQVPFLATSYLYNTAANGSGYYANQPGIEDFGNWIVNTLGMPQLRAETVTIIPSGTPQAWLMGLAAEVGDGVTLNRRSFGAPLLSMLQYISNIAVSINFREAKWETAYQLSGAPMLTVLACDDPVHGILSGSNLIGW